MNKKVYVVTEMSVVRDEQLFKTLGVFSSREKAIECQNKAIADIKESWGVELEAWKWKENLNVAGGIDGENSYYSLEFNDWTTEYTYNCNIDVMNLDECCK